MKLFFEHIFKPTMLLEGYTVTKPASVTDGVTTRWGLDEKNVYTSGNAQAANIKDLILSTLTYEQAGAIAYVNYFLRIPNITRCKLPIQFMIFDMFFHGVSKSAVVRIQNYVNGLEGMKKIGVDGVIGPNTMDRLSRLSDEQISKLLNTLSEPVNLESDASGHKNYAKMPTGFKRRYERRYATTLALLDVKEAASEPVQVASNEPDGDFRPEA